MTEREGDNLRNAGREMRAVLAILPLLLLSGCANPWTKVPEARLPKPVRYAMSRPSPFVIGNYCGPGTRTGDLSARPVDRLDAACRIHDACYIARHDHCECRAQWSVTLVGRISPMRAIPATRHDTRKKERHER